MRKRVLAALILIMVLSGCTGVGVATLKFAVYNDCENYIVDVNITANNEPVNHIAIERGYWADFGSAHVPGGVYVPIEIRVDYYDAETLEYVKTEVWNATDTFMNAIYGAGFVVNETGIWITKYPEESKLKEPVPVEIKRVG